MFLFLNTCFLFLGFEIPNPLMLPPPPLCTRQRTPFIMPAVIGFYYFGPQQPLSGLDILADHHWSVYVPLPIARQKENYFICLSAMAPFPAMVWVSSLSLSLMACT